MYFVRVNMTDGKITKEPIPGKYKMYGNRGLIARLAYDEIMPTCNPIGPLNKLLITSSPFEGYGITSAGRISVGGKSPLTGGAKEASAGGVGGSRMASHGIRAIIVDGRPAKDEFYILHINKSTMELLPAGDLRGKGTYETTKLLLDRYGKRCAVISIGQAGEQLLHSAAVFVNDLQGDSGRAAGRGGVGAIMGAKRIKAIVIENDGEVKKKPIDAERFREARRNLHKGIREHPGAQFYKNKGTMGFMMPINALGGMPTKGFTAGMYEDVEMVNGDKFLEIVAERGGEGRVTHACMPGCIVQCSNVYPRKNGKKHLSPLEYECGCLLGPNLCINDIDVIAELTYRCNDYGVDAIETGVALGVAAHAGLLNWGDEQRALELVDEIGEGTLLGKLIGSGAVAVGKVLGVDRVPAVKGQGMAAYDPRGIKSMAVTYAMTPMGADHTAAVTFRSNLDHARWEGSIDASRDLQVKVAFYDTYFCAFIERGIKENTGPLVELFNQILGTNYQDDSFFEKIGKDVIKYERAFNIAAGVNEEWMPEYMRYEPLNPHGRVSDIPESEYNRYWDEEYWGDFPQVPKRL